MYITLALSSMLRELVSHESTMVLQRLQELNNGELGSGSVIEPLTKPNLFMELKARNTDLAQLMQFSGPVKGCEVRTKPGFSFAGRK